MNILETAFESRNKKQNKVEKTKALKIPMNVYTQLEEIASLGYENLSKEDSGYFLKCFGLFDKGENFMLRVRLPIGQLNNEQAIRIGEVAQKYGNDYIDITTRMQIELRYIKIENIAKVLKELKDVGISTFQTGADNPRNIVADPLDGLAFDNIIDTKPIVDELQKMTIENPEWISVLPRKFNTGILGSLSNSCNIFGHDCCFVLANKNGEFGFNVYLGARVGVQSKDTNIFVTINEVNDFYMALLETFKTYGYRDNRNKNRLHFLLQDVGIKDFIDEVKRIAGKDFREAGQTLVQSQNISLGSNKVLLKNGKYAHKIIVPSGIFSGTDMIEVANRAKGFGSGNLRLTYDQNIFVVDIDKDSLEAFESTTIITKYDAYNNIYFNDMIACAGTKTCSFGVIPNKPDAIEMANFLNSEVAITNGMVRMNWSACPKGCGINGIADIGFEGCKAKDDNNNRVDGVHILIGGKITREAKEARVLHKSIPIIEAKYHIKYLLQTYKENKQRGESFEIFEDRFLSSNYSYQAIGFMTKINYILNDKLNLGVILELEDNPKTYKKENFEIIDFGMKLFKLLTNEKRFIGVDNEFEPILSQPRKIRRDEVSKINSKVPNKLSEVIYMMTDTNKSSRANVFSELLMQLKGV